MGNVQIVAQPAQHVQVIDNGVTVQIVAQQPANVVRVALEGPQGPKGEPGGDTSTLIADVAISALVCVSEIVPGHGTRTAPADVASLASIRGIAVEAAGAGQPINVQARGVLTDPAWSWGASAPIFVGANGVLTDAAPTAVASRQIAIAVSPTSIAISFGELFIL